MPPKRKSDATSELASKKVHLDADHVVVTTRLVDGILADPKDFEIPDDDDELRANILALAKYAQHLKDVNVPALVASFPPHPVVKDTQPSIVQDSETPHDELAAAIERVKKATAAGIKKQLVWRPACKANTAKWVYDGVCPDPEVFGAVFGLDWAPKSKQKKMSIEVFQEKFGWICGHTRYSNLYLNGSVTIRWSDEGTFKLSGTYGTGLL